MRPIQTLFVAACAVFLAACGADKTGLTIVVPTEQIDRSVVEELDAILNARSSLQVHLTSEPMSGEDALSAVAGWHHVATMRKILLHLSNSQNYLYLDH